MKEMEKRLGIQSKYVSSLKEKINDICAPPEIVQRTILIKTGERFLPDSTSLVDIKIKLIGNQSMLSIKHGVWHADATRQEFETLFARSSLANLIASLKVLAYDKFILLSSQRSVWKKDGLMVTLDEYSTVGDKAMLEVEAMDESVPEAEIDQFFADLGVAPMNSRATIAFIGELNKNDNAQIDLDKLSPTEVATIMLRGHA